MHGTAGTHVHLMLWIHWWTLGQGVCTAMVSCCTQHLLPVCTSKLCCSTCFSTNAPSTTPRLRLAAPGAARAVAAALPIRLAAPPAAADVPCTAAPTALPPKHHTFSHSTSRHSTAAVAAIRGPCQNNAAQRHAGSMGTLGTALKTPPALHMGVPTHDGNMATIPGSYLEHGHRAFVVST